MTSSPDRSPYACRDEKGPVLQPETATLFRSFRQGRESPFRTPFAPSPTQPPGCGSRPYRVGPRVSLKMEEIYVICIATGFAVSRESSLHPAIQLPKPPAMTLGLTRCSSTPAPASLSTGAAAAVQEETTYLGAEVNAAAFPEHAIRCV